MGFSLTLSNSWIGNECSFIRSYSTRLYSWISGECDFIFFYATLYYGWIGSKSSFKTYADTISNS